MTENKVCLLRRILRALGLSRQATDVVDFMVDLPGGESNSSTQWPEFPYHLRDKFLSPAELNFFVALKKTVDNRVTLCIKVGLGDIFWVRRNDPSYYRIYTNKIDRKHVDFLLCDSATMRPLLGIELDDKSHQRQDRQERDAFVDQVFEAAGLPLLHIPVKRNYVIAELAAQLAPFLGTAVIPVTTPTQAVEQAAPKKSVSETPVCPKCGSVMILRTAKSGANVGNRFWGCSNYPTCRSMIPYQS